MRPLLEVRLLRNLFFVADGLHKPLHYKSVANFYPDGSMGFAPATVVTWQFPLQARYRFAIGEAKLFLEGGPSFRTSGNVNRTTPSHHGVSVGAGVEGKWIGLSVAPGVRYTRWARDPHPESQDVKLRPDQFEFLLRFTWSVHGK